MCRKQCLRPDWFNIAFVGDDGPEPGVARLLAAVRGLPKVALIGVGRGRWPELAGEVVERQALPHRLVAEVLGAADLFVQLTTGASPGEGLMAAMACGLPVIASDGPGLDDVLSKEVAIRVDPRDAKALRGAIQTVVANPILRVAMAAASLKHARRFDIVHRARAMMEWIGCRLPARPGKPD
jgi:phosphatidylinositol alpha 1,6-mannosyltransferase